MMADCAAAIGDLDLAAGDAGAAVQVGQADAVIDVPAKAKREACRRRAPGRGRPRRWTMTWCVWASRAGTN